MVLVFWSRCINSYSSFSRSATDFSISVLMLFSSNMLLINLFLCYNRFSCLSCLKQIRLQKVTYPLFPFFGHHFLLPYHLFNVVILHELLVSLLFDGSFVELLLPLEPVGLLDLLHLHQLVLSHDVVPSSFSLLGILQGQLLLVHFALQSQLVLAVPVLFVPVSDYPDLVCFALGLLNLLPGFLLLEFEQSDSVRE